MKTSGNSVADFHTEIVYCETCNATGGLVVDRDEMKEYLRDGYAGHRWRGMLDMYRQWKKTGEVTCHECEGAGSWEQWS